MVNIYDPVGQGIIPSLARPGGNITGVVQDESADIAEKRLQFLRDAVPDISRVHQSLVGRNGRKTPGVVARIGACGQDGRSPREPY
jgi:hypothetical protein